MIRKVDTLQVLQGQRPENSAINARVKRQAELATDLIFSIFFWQIYSQLPIFVLSESKVMWLHLKSSQNGTLDAKPVLWKPFFI